MRGSRLLLYAFGSGLDSGSGVLDVLDGLLSLLGLLGDGLGSLLDVVLVLFALLGALVALLGGFFTSLGLRCLVAARSQSNGSNHAYSNKQFLHFFLIFFDVNNIV